MARTVHTAVNSVTWRRLANQDVTLWCRQKRDRKQRDKIQRRRNAKLLVYYAYLFRPGA